jgi:hypothetical protein
MGLVATKSVVEGLSPPLDRFLATQLLDEFVSMERRFIQRDWEPAELDGGQFAEILARTLYHQDSGKVDLKREFKDCMLYIEDEQSRNHHALQPRQHALHISKVLRTIYKFRSQRGAVHISPTYQPTHMDSKYLIEAVRWCLNETVRLFWQRDKEESAKAIREILQFDVPCIGTFEGAILVQRTDLTAEEEILVLLHYAGETGFSRKELGQHCMKSAPAITTALQTLISPSCREVVKLASGNYRLTDLGSRHIREDLAEKLLLQ